MSRPADQVAVRVGMRLADGQRLSELLVSCPTAVAAHLCDQLWLRAVLIEQRRHTAGAEREAFDRRADRILALLDPDDTARP
jgi:hypothetical protein